jgi:hypothetical protein
MLSPDYFPDDLVVASAVLLKKLIWTYHPYYVPLKDTVYANDLIDCLELVVIHHFPL